MVTLNGKVVRNLGMKADPYKDHIKVSNKLVTKFEPLIYILFNKPKGFITACSDPMNRPTVMDILKKIRWTIKPVGRLDYNTEGLLLLTNDGEMINRLTHPAYKVEKTYRVKIKGIPSKKSVDSLRKGVKIGRIKTLPARVNIVKVKEKNSWINITITEGKNLQIRKMCEAVGHPVVRLIRIKYAFLTLRNLKAGEYRYLTEREVEKFNTAAV